MRRWLVVLLVVMLLGVGALAVAVVNLDAWINANRDAVAEQVKGAIGREVAFGEVGLSLRGGLGVRVAQLRIGDDPAFSKEDFVSADAAELRVKILPALLGRIEVARVVLLTPRVTVIQTAQGLSTDSLGGREEQKPGQIPPEETPSSAALPLLVSLVDVRDGTLRFVDRTAKQPETLEVAQLDVRASDFSFTEPVDFELDAAVLGAGRQNLRVSGNLGPLGADPPQATLDLELDAVALDDALGLKAVRAALPAELSGSGPVRLEARVEGTLAQLAFRVRADARAAALRYGDGFEKVSDVPLDLSLRGTWTPEALVVESADLVLADTQVHATAKVVAGGVTKVDFSAGSEAVAPARFGAGEEGDLLNDLEVEGSLRLPSAGPRGRLTLRSPSGTLSRAPYRNLAIDVGLAGERITIEKLVADAFDGQLLVTGSYDTPKAGPPRFAVDTKLSGMRIEQLLATRSAAAAAFVSGTLGANLDLRGAGSDWEQIKRVLTGDGTVRLTDGVLEGFNPAGGTLSALVALPTMSGSGLARFVRDHPKVFGVEQTPFQVMDGKLEIRDGWLHARDFLLDAAEYGLSGRGRTSLDGNLDFKTVLTFSQQLSDELLAAEPRMRYLRGGSGRVEIPVALRGAMPKPSVLPDVSHLAASAGREALLDAVTRGLGGRTAPEPGAAPEAATPQAQAPEAPAPENAPPPTAEDVGRELLRQGLEGLLGGQRTPQQ
jgi:uncharacterized protein involved in outer membrane biogenesis